MDHAKGLIYLHPLPLQSTYVYPDYHIMVNNSIIISDIMVIVNTQIWPREIKNRVEQNEVRSTRLCGLIAIMSL